MEKRQYLYHSGDYLDVGEFMDDWRRDYGEELPEKEARQLLSVQAEDDLRYVAADVDAALARENPGGSLVARDARHSRDAPSGLSGPYGSFASLLGDTGPGGPLRGCDAFEVYVEGRSLFVTGMSRGAGAQIEVRALGPDQVPRLGEATEAFLDGRPTPLRRLWADASRILLLHGGVAVMPPGTPHPAAADAETPTGCSVASRAPTDRSGDGALQ